MSFMKQSLLALTPTALIAITASPIGAETVLPSVADLESSRGGSRLGQVTSVSQLTDVRPTDWAFQALQSLVERYGCIVGYPNKTYRGNQAMTRYEFAAGLNACMDKIQELIAAATADLVKKEDLLLLQRLQEEFGAELATLRGRVDGLEVRTATLEKQQFSTTTKLNGEVIFGLAGVATGDRVNDNDVQTNTVMGYRARLNFDASFTGEDLLRVRLQANNLRPFGADATFTPEGSLRFAASEDGSNQVGIDALLYQFNLGEKTTVVLEANAGATDDFVPTLNPFLDGDGGSGALSDFGTRNPIYYLLGGAGVGVTHQFSEQLGLSVGYLASDPANPRAGSGLFNGPYGAIAQLTFTPNEKLGVGLTYIHAYNNDISTAGNTGSTRANVLSFLNDSGIADVATTSDAFGLQATFQINPGIVLNGSVGYTNVDLRRGGRGSADIWNWMVGLAFPDLGKRGNLAGILVGMEPKVTNATRTLRTVGLEDEDTSLHIEAFYQYRINDNLAITPGIIWLTAPDHNNNNSDVVIGAVRATFTF